MTPITTHASANDTQPHVVIIGAGWSGFAASKALSEAGGVKVTLLEASQVPGGLRGD